MDRDSSGKKRDYANSNVVTLKPKNEACASVIKEKFLCILKFYINHASYGMLCEPLK